MILNKRILLIAFSMIFATLTLAAKDLRQVVFSVEQLECENCAKKVRNNLRFERGIKTIDTRVAERRVVVTYDAGKTSAKKLAAAFGKFSYTAVIVKDCALDKDGRPACPPDTAVATAPAAPCCR